MSSSEHWKKLWRENSGGMVMNKSEPIEHKIMKELLKESPNGDSVLEAGSGTGKISSLLAFYGKEATLLDISCDAINFSRKLFQKKSLNGTFVIGDIFKMPFKNDSFDIVWNSGVIEHYSSDDQKKIYSEMRRVCKNDGKIIIIAPSAKGKIYLFFKEKLEKRGKWLYGKEDPVLSLHFLSPREFIHERQIAPVEQICFVCILYNRFSKIFYLLYRFLNFLERLPLFSSVFERFFGSYLLISVFKKDAE